VWLLMQRVVLLCQFCLSVVYPIDPSAAPPSLFWLSKFGWRADQNSAGDGGILRQFVSVHVQHTETAKESGQLLMLLMYYFMGHIVIYQKFN